ncbi:hypothetical protein OC834_003024 [Tilletia horrida]|nr:hypothetical protein OC834_003024 [Tilletia horrida]
MSTHSNTIELDLFAGDEDTAAAILASTTVSQSSVAVNSTPQPPPVSVGPSIIEPPPSSVIPPPGDAIAAAQSAVQTSVRPSTAQSFRSVQIPSRPSGPRAPGWASAGDSVTRARQGSLPPSSYHFSPLPAASALPPRAATGVPIPQPSSSRSSSHRGRHNHHRPSSSSSSFGNLLLPGWSFPARSSGQSQQYPTQQTSAAESTGLLAPGSGSGTGSASALGLCLGTETGTTSPASSAVGSVALDMRDAAQAGAHASKKDGGGMPQLGSALSSGLSTPSTSTSSDLRANGNTSSTRANSAPLDGPTASSAGDRVGEKQAQSPTEALSPRNHARFHALLSPSMAMGFRNSFPTSRSASSGMSFLNLRSVASLDKDSSETPFMTLVNPNGLGTALYDGPEDDDELHGGWTPPGGSDDGDGEGEGGVNRRNSSSGPSSGLISSKRSRFRWGKSQSNSTSASSSRNARSTKRADPSKCPTSTSAARRRKFRLCTDLRGFLNVATLVLLASALVFIFAGWPVMTAFLPNRFAADTSANGPFFFPASDRAARIRPPKDYNVSGAAAQTLGFGLMRTGLIDPDTPLQVRSKVGTDGRRMKLVFSDEFNTERRTFFPGDDPFWLAQDLHYWGTGDYEFYHPSAVTTRNGYLSIKLSQENINGLRFKSGMINAWNSFCFTGGRIELSVRIAGAPDVMGLWPAAWLMGNLGRAGFGASTHGTWPYSYDHCSVGTLANQTYGPNGTGGPLAAEMTGVYIDQYGPGLSYLPGQRLSRCTCANSTDHPGPRHPDGSWKGRSAPELDLFEASSSDGGFGWNSMSLQLAPYDAGYNLTRPDMTIVYHPERGDQLNPYTGSPYQQAVSALIKTNQEAYELSGGKFAIYGLEYEPASERQNDGYVTWISDGDRAWNLIGAALGPDVLTEIGQRLIPQEPMYPIMNLGISSSFTWLDWKHLRFPAEMLIDYIRIWQPEDAINIGCDGLDGRMPTTAYIQKHAEAYANANLTTWSEPRERAGYGKKFPGNAMRGECA